ncbi:APC family permease [Dactylosporangium fulvum]|uniref:APC family permease n=1 Tax=Dactylosporangium fulvum TaxID=53359 RepID=A0ABY5VRJ1_9ACTN|nr:APC family permease [Dactylosporangium fulvum]UWP79812.1 APC family permease [Dactylosporangium fulvum]
MTTHGLTRRRMSGGGVWLFQVGASSPMAVLAGGIVATYATTGVVATPLTFPLLGTLLGLLAVGYVAMSRAVPHAAPAYALLAHGFGPVTGMVGGALALVFYSAIQMSLYGLVGVTIADLVGGSWVLWSGAVWLVVAVCGLLHVSLSAFVVGSVLCVELAVIALFDIAGFTHPAGGAISTAPVSIDGLWSAGIGGAFTLGIAAFIGFDTAPAYSEEVRTSRSISRSTLAAVLFMALFYGVSAWSLAVAVGADQVAPTAADPDAGLPFSLLDQWYGNGLSLLATLLLVTSVVVAMLSFHNTIARYLFAMAREGVLPGWLARTGASGRAQGAPTGGSIVQSVSALLVVGAFTLVGADPLKVIFTWFSAAGAVGILVMLVLISAAAIRYFRRGGGSNESLAITTVLPTLGVIAGAGVLAIMVLHLSSLLRIADDSPLQAIIPAVVVATIVVGVIWGMLLRARRARVLPEIGRGRPDPLRVLDQRLQDLDV